MTVKANRESSRSMARIEFCDLQVSADQERVKAEARKKAFDRYKEYADKLKQEGKEIPAEKRAYFDKFRKGESFEK